MNLRGIVNRLIGRKPKWVPPMGSGKEHDDWRVGDLATCRAKGQWHRLESGQACNGPRFGDLLRVSNVGMSQGWHWLEFEGVGDAWTAECFRKIRPNQRQACTEGFKLRMKGLRPKVDA